MTEATSASPHILPLHEEMWNPALDQVLARLGVPLNIHRLLANNPKLLLAWMPYRDYIVANSNLTDRHRELIILRNAWISDTNYEWQHHLLRSKKAGLSTCDIECVKQGPDDIHWEPSESCLLRAVDELIRTSAIGAETWEELALHFSADQRLDLIFTVGAYKTLSMVIHTNGLDMDRVMENS